jgi:hypothetical protein
MPIKKPWHRFPETVLREIPGTLGVYELGDAEGRVIYIGYAGGRSLFGLRGAIGAHFAGPEPNPVIRDRARVFRYEVNTNYLVRRVELLSRYREDEGRLPDANEASPEALPRLARYNWRSTGEGQWT